MHSLITVNTKKIFINNNTAQVISVYFCFIRKYFIL